MDDHDSAPCRTIFFIKFVLSVPRLPVINLSPKLNSLINFPFCIVLDTSRNNVFFPDDKKLSTVSGEENIV